MERTAAILGVDENNKLVLYCQVRNVTKKPCFNVIGCQNWNAIQLIADQLIDRTLMIMGHRGVGHLKQLRAH